MHTLTKRSTNVIDDIFNFCRVFKKGYVLEKEIKVVDNFVNALVY